jgi:hypothetical protein
MRRANRFNNLPTTDLSLDLHVALFRSHFMRVFRHSGKPPGCSQILDRISRPLLATSSGQHDPIGESRDSVFACARLKLAGARFLPLLTQQPVADHCLKICRRLLDTIWIIEPGFVRRARDRNARVSVRTPSAQKVGRDARGDSRFMCRSIVVSDLHRISDTRHLRRERSHASITDSSPRQRRHTSPTNVRWTHTEDRQCRQSPGNAVNHIELYWWLKAGRSSRSTVSTRLIEPPRRSGKRLALPVEWRSAAPTSIDLCGEGAARESVSRYRLREFATERHVGDEAFQLGIFQR